VVILVPDELVVNRITPDQLPAQWHKTKNYPLCQPLGEAWYQSRSSPVLEVPSSIIPKEYNYILNTRHPDFQAIQILRREDFDFDPRIKTQEGDPS
jgi:RES domain-containing protein